jgi:hypothetical protein
VALIIGLSGMTCQLQTFDVSINRPFKHLCEHWDAWLNKDNHIQTPTCKIKTASASVIVEWISQTWKKVMVSIIPKPFAKCSLSNVVDWESIKQSGEGASSSQNERVTKVLLDELSDEINRTEARKCM